MCALRKLFLMRAENFLILGSILRFLVAKGMTIQFQLIQGFLRKWKGLPPQPVYKQGNF
jgi:hypothetical protein